MNNSSSSGIVKKATISILSNLKRDSQTAGNKLCAQTVTTIKNDLLTALSSEDMEFLMPHLELIYIPSNKRLFDYDEKLSYVYFPTTAVIALLYLLADGSTIEIAVVGHDGLLGISALLGEAALGTATVQTAGYAYRLKAAVLKEAFSCNRNLQQVLMRYTQALFEQIAQNAVCNRHYTVDQQLSRWLLSRLDRLPGNTLKMTQAMIAGMLGVRRETITESAGRLQKEGLIQYCRGSITVLNRKGLEVHAGECYQATRRKFELNISNG